MTHSIISWNVNGIRAIEKKGFLDWLQSENPDILCVQETKARPEQLSEQLRSPEGYRTYFSSAKRPGYSGVALFSKKEPDEVTNFGLPLSMPGTRISSGTSSISKITQGRAPCRLANTR